MGILDGIENRYLLESFEDHETGSGVKYIVADYRYPFCPKNNIRRIEFENGGSYLYSSVFLSDRQVFQPLYPCAQRIADCFFKFNPIDKALVLGCAGCTVPRFLINRYKSCRVTGVEYSKTLIEIADKYFISDRMKERFELINDDAFMFVKEAAPDSYSLVFVDIFVAEKIHSSVFSQGFYDDLYRICGDDSIVIINLFGLTGKKARELSVSITAAFDVKYVVEDLRKYFLALIKTRSRTKLDAFEKRLKRYAEINDRISAGDQYETKPTTHKKDQGL